MCWIYKCTPLSLLSRYIKDWRSCYRPNLPWDARESNRKHQCSFKEVRQQEQRQKHRQRKTQREEWERKRRKERSGDFFFQSAKPANFLILQAEILSVAGGASSRATIAQSADWPRSSYCHARRRCICAPVRSLACAFLYMMETPCDMWDSREEEWECLCVFVFVCVCVSVCLCVCVCVCCWCTCRLWLLAFVALLWERSKNHSWV